LYSCVYSERVQLLEHEAKALASQAGIRIPRGHVASTVAEAVDAAAALGRAKVAIKAQVPTGGRGKAGGIAVAPLRDVGDVAGANVWYRRSSRASSGSAPTRERLFRKLHPLRDPGGVLLAIQ